MERHVNTAVLLLVSSTLKVKIYLRSVRHTNNYYLCLLLRQLRSSNERSRPARCFRLAVCLCSYSLLNFVAPYWHPKRNVGHRQ